MATSYWHQSGITRLVRLTLFWTTVALCTRRASPQGPTTNVNTTMCGVSKSCFLRPDQCTTGSCQYVLTWVSDGQSINFEMEAAVSSSNSWIAFGLSYDQDMGSDDVIECVYNDQTGTFTIQFSKNVGHTNVQVANNQLGFVSGSTSAAYINGRITCLFTRLISTTSSSGRRKRQATSDSRYPLDSAAYYILMAQGPASGGSMQYHTGRVSSSTTVNFTAPLVNVGVSSDSNLSIKLIKAHGILMVLAWMVFASFGMLFPRYCKTSWPDTTWCGNKIWFQFHQPCMIITLLLTAAGFIIIFVEAGEYVADLPAPTSAHPPLGIIVMALVLINPIMAIFRCKPGAKNRIIFNIFHFVVGLLAHLSAVVTIFLGLYMAQLGLPIWTKGVMAAFICFHAIIEVVLAIHMHASKLCERKSAGFEDIAMEQTGIEKKKTLSTQSDSGSKFKSVVLAIHLVGVLGFAIAISVQIGLSSGN